MEVPFIITLLAKKVKEENMDNRLSPITERKMLTSISLISRGFVVEAQSILTNLLIDSRESWNLFMAELTKEVSNERHN